MPFVAFTWAPVRFSPIVLLARSSPLNTSHGAKTHKTAPIGLVQVYRPIASQDKGSVALAVLLSCVSISTVSVDAAAEATSSGTPAATNAAIRTSPDCARASTDSASSTTLYVTSFSYDMEAGSTDTFRAANSSVRLESKATSARRADTNLVANPAPDISDETSSVAVVTKLTLCVGLPNSRRPVDRRRPASEEQSLVMLHPALKRPLSAYKSSVLASPTFAASDFAGL